jgi:hypothetical protein
MHSTLSLGKAYQAYWFLVCVTVLVHLASAGFIGVLLLICTWDSHFGPLHMVSQLFEEREKNQA